MSNFRLFSSALAVLDICLLSLSNTKANSNLGPLLFVSLCFFSIPLSLIWFGDAIGGYIGPAGRNGYIDTPTPGWLLACFGWLLLLIPVMGACYGSLESRKELSPSSIAMPTVSPSPLAHPDLPQEVTLTTPFQIPVSSGGRSVGTALLPRGTCLELISVHGDSLVVSFLGSTTIIPTSATDLNEK